MMLFNYSKKSIIIFTVIFSLLLLTIIFLSVKNYSRAKDLVLLAQMQSLAQALENYYSQANQYPVLAETDYRQIKLLTENAWNQNGDYIFYKAPAKFLRDATLKVDKDNYILKFELKNSWKVWNLSKFSGGECTITNNIAISCR